MIILPRIPPGLSVRLHSGWRCDQVLHDLPRGRRLIEGIEVNARNPAFQQFLGLAGGVLDPDLFKATVAIAPSGTSRRMAPRSTAIPIGPSASRNLANGDR